MADPTGVGFAFGGVIPGHLHSKGALVDWHKVHFAIGRAGKYLLHVRLHRSGRALPGSPYALTVGPGAAHHTYTVLAPPMQPLRGEVGYGSGDGCSLILKTADRSGNPCTEGGADVKVTTSKSHVEATVVDQGDGSYLLSWRSKYSTLGVTETRVSVNGSNIEGSPMTIQLISTRPERTKAEAVSLGDARTEGLLSERVKPHVPQRSKRTFEDLKPLVDLHNGVGLQTAVSGIPASILLRFRDEHGNPSTPGDSYKIGMAINKEKHKLNELVEHPDYSGSWGAEDTGLYVLTYIAKTAGATELSLWCEPDANGLRELLPGSPWSLIVSSGAATTAESYVDGWTVEKAKRQGDKSGGGSSSVSAGKASPSKGKDGKGGKEEDESRIIAGDQVIVRAYGVDQYNNPAPVPDGAMSAHVILPGGKRLNLPVALQTKAGRAATYDLRHETELSGQHEVHVLLNHEPIKGSPATWLVEPDRPVPTTSKLVSPNDSENLVADFERPSIVLLRTFDRFGNACNTGGLRVSGRLHLVKHNIADNTILMPNNHSVTVDDLHDGTYAVKVAIMMAATVKLVVNMDKDLPGTTGELPPVQLSFMRLAKDVAIHEAQLEDLHVHEPVEHHADESEPAGGVAAPATSTIGDSAEAAAAAGGGSGSFSSSSSALKTPQPALKRRVSQEAFHAVPARAGAGTPAAAGAAPPPAGAGMVTNKVKQVVVGGAEPVEESS